MPIATLTSKGQVTIPQSVRNALGLQPGAKIDFVAQGDGFRVVPVAREVSSLKGRFAGRVKKPVSVESMNDAVAEGVLLRHAKATRGNRK